MPCTGTYVGNCNLPVPPLPELCGLDAPGSAGTHALSNIGNPSVPMSAPLPAPRMSARRVKSIDSMFWFVMISPSLVHVVVAAHHRLVCAAEDAAAETVERAGL